MPKIIKKKEHIWDEEPEEVEEVEEEEIEKPQPSKKFIKKKQEDEEVYSVQRVATQVNTFVYNNESEQQLELTEALVEILNILKKLEKAII